MSYDGYGSGASLIGMINGSSNQTSSASQSHVAEQLRYHYATHTYINTYANTNNGNVVPHGIAGRVRNTRGGGNGSSPMAQFGSSPPLRATYTYTTNKSNDFHGIGSTSVVNAGTSQQGTNSKSSSNNMMMPSMPVMGTSYPLARPPRHHNHTPQYNGYAPLSPGVTNNTNTHTLPSPRDGNGNGSGHHSNSGSGDFTVRLSTAPAGLSISSNSDTDDSPRSNNNINITMSDMSLSSTSTTSSRSASPTSTDQSTWLAIDRLNREFGFFVKNDVSSASMAALGGARIMADSSYSPRTSGDNSSNNSMMGDTPMIPIDTNVDILEIAHNNNVLSPPLTPTQYNFHPSSSISSSSSPSSSSSKTHPSVTRVNSGNSGGKAITGPLAAAGLSTAIGASRKSTSTPPMTSGLNGGNSNVGSRSSASTNTPLSCMNDGLSVRGTSQAVLIPSISKRSSLTSSAAAVLIPRNAHVEPILVSTTATPTTPSISNHSVNSGGVSTVRNHGGRSPHGNGGHTMESYHITSNNTGTAAATAAAAPSTPRTTTASSTAIAAAAAISMVSSTPLSIAGVGASRSARLTSRVSNSGAINMTIASSPPSSFLSHAPLSPSTQQSTGTISEPVTARRPQAKIVMTNADITSSNTNTIIRTEPSTIISASTSPATNPSSSTISRRAHSAAIARPGTSARPPSRYAHFQDLPLPSYLAFNSLGVLTLLYSCIGNVHHQMHCI
jgi:hypothetical protein